MCVFCNVWVCVCACFVMCVGGLCVGVCMCVFCNVFVYVWVFCNVCVCVCVWVL